MPGAVRFAIANGYGPDVAVTSPACVERGELGRRSRDRAGLSGGDLGHHVRAPGRSVRARLNGLSVALRSARPRVSVVVVVAIMTSSSAAWTGRRLMSPITSRQIEQDAAHAAFSSPGR